jgi:MFS family permease
MDFKYSSNSYRHELIGVGVGAAFGSLLAPAENRSLGLAIGVIVGGLLGSVWGLWISKRQRSEAGSSISWFGRMFYLVGMGLCIYMLWLAYRTWLFYPERWLAALTGFLFFGGGTVVIGFLWWGEFTSGRLTGATRNTALAICSFIIALASLFTIFLGNIVFGALGTVLFSLCGVAALRKAKQNEAG